ncbi:MAG: collagen-like protein [Aeromicrobium sp.]
MTIDDAEFDDLIARAVARLDPSLERRLDTEPQAHLDLVLVARRAHDQTNKLLHAAVTSARAAGWSWESIGSALGMSRQAAQQRFGHKPAAAPETAEHRQLVGLTAFSEMDQLEEWGRHGWHSVGHGPLFHDVEKSPVQWEHKRAVVGSRKARDLEAKGWERIGTMWFPWVYLKRSLDVPAVPGEPGAPRAPRAPGAPGEKGEPA